jgi:hypothetical protein
VPSQRACLCRSTLLWTYEWDDGRCTGEIITCCDTVHQTAEVCEARRMIE